MSDDLIVPPDTYHKLRNVDPREILIRIANGERPTAIAKSLGVAKSAITQRFGKLPEYKKAREIGQEVRLDEKYDALEDAGDDLNLARAREIPLRQEVFRAGVEFPDRWGRVEKHQHEFIGDLGDRLRRSRERVIDGAAQQIDDAQCVMSNGNTQLIDSK